jgi:hypothetical protein
LEETVHAAVEPISNTAEDKADGSSIVSADTEIGSGILKTAIPDISLVPA